MIALGMDLGTSSVKALLLGPGMEYEESCAYIAPDFEGMIATVKKVCMQMNDHVPLRQVDAVGLSGRTGTYALMSRDGTVGPWMEWYAGGREEALERLLAAFSPEACMEMIGMPHPRLSSYPVPMLLCTPPEGRILVQPKDALMAYLTGECLSDPGSWRGLYHPGKREYSRMLLDWAGASEDELPRIGEMAQLNGQGAALLGLREGTPVYTGMNDFYSALYGMGIDGPGCGFDVTGTSEHIGLTRLLPGQSSLITSPYRSGYVHYGVTASSGPSLTWGRKLFGRVDPEIRPHAPIFLPYLQGERAPVFDTEARGMFMGLTPRTDEADLRYAVYEGVAFSMRNIRDVLGEDMPEVLRITGGASRSPLLCRLKASLLGCRVQRERLDCGSAMGAVRIAGGQWQREMEEYEPDGTLAGMLEERYLVYARLYDAWKIAMAGMDAGRLFGKE